MRAIAPNLYAEHHLATADGSIFGGNPGMKLQIVQYFLTKLFGELHKSTAPGFAVLPEATPMRIGPISTFFESKPRRYFWSRDHFLQKSPN